MPNANQTTAGEMPVNTDQAAATHAGETPAEQAVTENAANHAATVTPITAHQATAATADTPTIAELEAEIERLRAALSTANGESATRRHTINELRPQAEQAASLQAEAQQLTETLASQQQLMSALVQQRFTELNVPAHVQAAIADRSAADQLAYLNEHVAAFRPNSVPNVNGANQQAATTTMTNEERNTLAARLNVNPEHLPQ